MKSKGFTLFEFVIVLMIVAIIAALAAPRLIDAVQTKEQKEAAMQAKLLSFSKPAEVKDFAPATKMAIEKYLEPIQDGLGGYRVIVKAWNDEPSPVRYYVARVTAEARALYLYTGERVKLKRVSYKDTLENGGVGGESSYLVAEPIR